MIEIPWNLRDWSSNFEDHVMAFWTSLHSNETEGEQHIGYVKEWKIIRFKGLKFQKIKIELPFSLPHLIISVTCKCNSAFELKDALSALGFS